MELHNIIHIAGFTEAGLPYLAYDNVNPATVNSLRSSMLAFEKVYYEGVNSTKAGKFSLGERKLGTRSLPYRH